MAKGRIYREEKLSPPYTTILGRTVYSVFYDTDGSIIRWETPIESIELRQYIDANTFAAVMPELYNKSKDDEEFIRKVWNIVGQLTVYSPELEETPRFAVETLVSAGGDCEDLAIFAASMIKAANPEWKVQMVYMDAYNPTDPQEVNHVILHVDTGEYSAFFEATSKDQMNPYTEVEGWYFEV